MHDKRSQTAVRHGKNAAHKAAAASAVKIVSIHNFCWGWMSIDIRQFTLPQLTTNAIQLTECGAINSSAKEGEH